MLPTQNESTSTVVAMEALRRAEPRFRWLVWTIWCVVLTGASLYNIYWTDEKLSQEEPLMRVLVSILLGALWASILYGGYCWARSLAYRLMLNRATANAIEHRTESLQEDLEKDFFNNLVKINFKYLDKYYLQTQIQADKAFNLSVVAALVGLLIVIAGIVQMYLGRTEPAYVTTAAGVTSEFIAAVFFYLYNQTILKMADYHKKLVLTQNIGLALRITQDLPEAERVISQCSLVDRLTTDINAMLVSAKVDS